MKPGERCLAAVTHWRTACSDTGSSGARVGGTRGMGCGGTVRSLVHHRGTGPGPRFPLVLPCFGLRNGPVLTRLWTRNWPLFGDTEKNHWKSWKSWKWSKKWSEKCTFCKINLKLVSKPYPILGGLRTFVILVIFRDFSQKVTFSWFSVILVKNPI